MENKDLIVTNKFIDIMYLTKHPDNPCLSFNTSLRITAFSFVVIQHFTLTQLKSDENVQHTNDSHWYNEEQEATDFKRMLEKLIFHL